MDPLQDGTPDKQLMPIIKEQYLAVFFSVSVRYWAISRVSSAVDIRITVLVSFLAHVALWTETLVYVASTTVARALDILLTLAQCVITCPAVRHELAVQVAASIDRTVITLLITLHNSVTTDRWQGSQRIQRLNYVSMWRRGMGTCTCTCWGQHKHHLLCSKEGCR